MRATIPSAPTPADSSACSRSTRRKPPRPRSSAPKASTVSPRKESASPAVPQALSAASPTRAVSASSFGTWGVTRGLTASDSSSSRRAPSGRPLVSTGTPRSAARAATVNAKLTSALSQVSSRSGSKTMRETGPDSSSLATSAAEGRPDESVNGPDRRTRTWPWASRATATRAPVPLGGAATLTRPPPSSVRLARRGAPLRRGRLLRSAAPAPARERRLRALSRLREHGLHARQDLARGVLHGHHVLDQAERDGVAEPEVAGGGGGGVHVGRLVLVAVTVGGLGVEGLGHVEGEDGCVVCSSR